MKPFTLLDSLQLFIFLIFFYIVVSWIEWFFHYYFMHFNGGLKELVEKLNIKVENSHIEHHKETLLDQSLTDDFIEEGLVFNLLDPENFFIIFLTVLSCYFFWRYFPKFKSQFSFTFIFIITIILSYAYFYVWSSIHSKYHSRYIDVNKPLNNKPDKTIYSIFNYFIPDTSLRIYKFLFWYHTLHHLNKGEDKCNYNTVCPFFDFILGTYKSKVNNTVYFSKNNPTNKRDEWLRAHLVFDIRVLDNNILEYKDQDSDVWNRMPSI